MSERLVAKEPCLKRERLNAEKMSPKGLLQKSQVPSRERLDAEKSLIPCRRGLDAWEPSPMWKRLVAEEPSPKQERFDAKEPSPRWERLDVEKSLILCGRGLMWKRA
ncbi:hypothetical protein Fot_04669 [Forsythia ovata]|uniref:Uncharacterized protein n=1 Tax=Forsythia ovata TaxID=205694 RepID=A0ABD1XE21_9LAMI